MRTRIFSANRLAAGASAAMLAFAVAPSARASCGSPANAIEAENCLPGSVWAVPSSNTSIEGYATAASVNPGTTISFKVKTTAAAYTLSIYRMGHYGGLGARLQATVSPSIALPQTQPACLSDSSTGLIDCGNWAVSALWSVPSNAVSGIYFVILKRADTGASNIFSFVVRNDASRSDLLYQAQDTTQQAYNNYGGNSLYVGSPAGRAYKVSFNRPPANEGVLWDLFTYQAPLIRWLEMNSYDISYISGVDSDRNGALLLNHKVFLSGGHDEYWSGSQRSNVEAARDAGVNLAFFTGNTMYWKTRWENSIDGSGTDHRTLVCYKETEAGAKIDPLDPPTWTGLWMDGQFSPPADGGRPENAILGSGGNVYGPSNRNDAMNVRAEDGALRFWRNTALASMLPGTVMSFPQMLGYEWNEYVDNGLNPPGLISLSSSPIVVPSHVGNDTKGNYVAGQALHRLIAYRAASGALVFGAGTMQWGWFLDSHHDFDVTPPAVNPNIQQATVNLFADMGAQPATLQAGLFAASQSTDVSQPVSSVLTAPQIFNAGTLATISGTAADVGGGVVGAVEVSTDNGVSWRPAEGRSSWTYSWKPALTALVTPMSRAVDDSGNLEGRAAPTNPVPAITALSPPGAAIGGPVFTLSVTGSGFISSSTVLWNGEPRATAFINSSQLNATIPASDLIAMSTAEITVFNPEPGGGTSTPKAFVVGNPPPSLLALAPSSATAGGPGFTMTLSGANFVNGSSVLWNGTSRATVFVSATQLTAAINAADIASASTAAVTVSNPGPGGGISTRAFVVANPAPSLLSLAPSGAIAGGPGFTMTLAGANFVNGSSVLWNGTSRATVFVSATQLTAAINAADIASASTAAVTVSNPGPGGGISTRAFVVANPAPSLLSLAPSGAIAGGPGFTMTLAGANFVNGSSVLWNGTSRATVFVSATQLTAAINAADIVAASTAAVTVSNPGPGGGISTRAFVVANPAASLLGVAPSSAIAGGSGITMALTGANFVNGSNVLWNGASRATVFINSTRLTAAISAADLASATTANVSVVNPEPGGGESSVQAFVVANPAPLLLGVSPAGSMAGGPGFELAVSGVNFVNSSSILWNGASRATVFVSSTQLTALISAADLASAASAAVAVASPGPGGGVTSVKLFVVADPRAADLSGIRIFPNPWRADRHQGVPIHIDHSTAGGEIRIFTISGRWLRTVAMASDGTASWDLRNSAGQRVGSGLYIYLLTDGAGHRSRGTLAVVQ